MGCSWKRIINRMALLTQETKILLLEILYRGEITAADMNRLAGLTGINIIAAVNVPIAAWIRANDANRAENKSGHR